MYGGHDKGFKQGRRVHHQTEDKEQVKLYAGISGMGKSKASSGACTLFFGLKRTLVDASVTLLLALDFEKDLRPMTSKLLFTTIRNGKALYGAVASRSSWEAIASCRTNLIESPKLDNLFCNGLERYIMGWKHIPKFKLCVWRWKRLCTRTLLNMSKIRSARGFSDKFNDDTRVIKGKSKSGGVYKRQMLESKKLLETAVQLTLASAKDLTLRSSSKVCDHIIQTNVPAADISINSAASVMMSVESVGKKQAGSSSISVDCFFTRLLWYTENNIPSDKSSDVMINYPKSCYYSREYTVDCDMHSHGNLQESDAQVCSGELGVKKSDNLSSAMSKYDSIESELEIVEKFDESQLEETCVLVEEDRAMFHMAQSNRSPIRKARKLSPRKEVDKLLQELISMNLVNPEITVGNHADLVKEVQYEKLHLLLYIPHLVVTNGCIGSWVGMGHMQNLPIFMQVENGLNKNG
ncbi:hypothetical protein HAX54_020680 [Datura stramonium]|uniref:Uncharacterized protein n=1 Tax=Datura stramonium TaxID=4076 RepID=A0ABS8UT43_DATST|nr:hypothetical protein [Datura stramonium]